MDPASILGAVAAACQLAELAAKGAIKGAGLLKSLKDMPAKLTELLAIVQTSKRNVVQLRDHLTQPTLMGLLTQSQLQSLQDDINTAYKAADELETSLESLLGPMKHDFKGMKRLWRDVISLKRDGEIKNSFETIQRRNEQIYRELSNLQLTLSTKNLETSVAIQTKVDDNKTVLADIRNQVVELGNRRTDVGLDVTVHSSSLTTAQQAQASPSTTRVEIELQLEPATVREELRSELMLMMTGGGPYSTSVNALLPSLLRLSHQDRTALASMLLMKQIQHPDDPSRENNLAAAVIYSPRHPASPTSICGCNIKTHNTEKTFRHGLLSWGYGYRNQKRHQASCPYNIGEAARHTWKYHLCMQLLPFANKTVQIAFSATVGQGGLELRFPLKVFPTVQRGNSPIFMLFDNFAQFYTEIEPFFGHHGSEERWYPEVFPSTESEFASGRHKSDDDNNNSSSGFTWTIDRIRQELRHLYRMLCDAHTLKVGSIKDRDESGYTVFHELMILVLYLLPVYTHVSNEITDLMKLVSASGIEAHAVADGNIFGSRRLCAVPYLSKGLPKYRDTSNNTCRVEAYPLKSATDALRISLPAFGQMLDSREEPHLLVDPLVTVMSLDFGPSSRPQTGLGNLGLYDDMEPDEIYDHGRKWIQCWRLAPSRRKCSVHHALLMLLRRRPNLSTSIFPGELARIVLDRDLHTLQRFLTSPTTQLNWESQAFGFTEMSILDLAVGWPEGLKALSAVWTWDASGTFWLAFRMSDDDSCRQILDSAFMPMNSFAFIWLMRGLCKARATGTGTGIEWAQIVVQSHVRRRAELAALGRKHLSHFDQERLGLGVLGAEGKPLDAQAREVYDLLKAKAIDIPLALHPGWGIPIYHLLAAFSESPYPTYRNDAGGIMCTSREEFCESFLLVKVADQLFENGFTMIDKAQPFKKGKEDMWVETPLGRVTRCFDGLYVLPLCVWFLQRGAKSNFPPPPVRVDHIHGQGHRGGIGYPSERGSSSLLMRLATGCGSQPDSHWSLIRLLVRYVSGLSTSPLRSRHGSTVTTDGCVCYCLASASDGCLPLRLHAGNDSYARSCNRHEHRANTFVSWIEACSLAPESDETSLAFEQAVRLELFERLGLVHTCCQGSMAWALYDSDEFRRIRDDDEELASQLELLVLAYRGSLLMFLHQHLNEKWNFSTAFECGCHEFENLGKPPQSSWGNHNLDSHATRLLAHWRHWWTRTDPILADIWGITRSELDTSSPTSTANSNGGGDRDLFKENARRMEAETRTRCSLEKMGYTAAGLDYEEVIEQHFREELGYARENIKPVMSGGDGYYWEKKKFDDDDDDATEFVPVCRPELLDECMERMKRAASGEGEMWMRETEVWSRIQ